MRVHRVQFPLQILPRVLRLGLAAGACTLALSACESPTLSAPVNESGATALSSPDGGMRNPDYEPVCNPDISYCEFPPFPVTGNPDDPPPSPPDDPPPPDMPPGGGGEGPPPSGGGDGTCGAYGAQAAAAGSFGGVTPASMPLPGCGGGDGLPGDQDGDGDTLDDGPIEFGTCVAAKMGYSGWSALVTAGYTEYKLFDARKATADAALQLNAQVREYTTLLNRYHAGDPSVTEMDVQLKRDLVSLYQQSYDDEQHDEAQLEYEASLASGVAEGFIAGSILVCAPIELIPIP